MFTTLGSFFANAGGLQTDALRVHPSQLSRWLEEVWARGPSHISVGQIPGTEPFLGEANARQSFVAPLSMIEPSGIVPGDPAAYSAGPGPSSTQPAIWHHLIYAYLLENTGLVEIFAEVLRRAAYGETLEIERVDAFQWLRSTEELFFRDPPLFSSGRVGSQLRPESRVIRRNAYWRMFGLDLSHPIPGPSSNGARDWKQHTSNGVNTSFRAQWAELLRQIWLGIENRSNFSGAKATDDAYLRLLCESLRDMLNMRRRGGALAREEFAAVAMLSWFDLTLSDDTPIVRALNATAKSKSDRLSLIAQKVGMKPAPRSQEMFELAGHMSLFLRLIEAGVFSIDGNVPLFYDSNQPAPSVYTTINRIIDLWQSATGERVKDRPTGNVVATVPAQPVRIPGAQPGSAPRLVSRTTAGGQP